MTFCLVLYDLSLLTRNTLELLKCNNILIYREYNLRIMLLVRETIR
jgi:hypothetical protein